MTHSRSRITRVLVAGAMLLVFASAVLAQTGTISGTVRDTTGAVLPGATVEAVSPALIEKLRTAVTDEQGLYRIVDLRPGIYTVTITLEGFSTFERAGIDLPGGVTLTVNAELRVGAVAETVTVSGQSPLVDVVNSTQHHRISQQLIEELPTAKNFAQMAVLIPGAGIGTIPFVPSKQDVGGSTGDHVPNLTFHGSAAGDMPQIFDGLRYSSGLGSGGGSAGVWIANAATVQEFAIDTSGTGAESISSGIRINIIPKQGGNRFTGYFLGNYTNDSLQSDNLDDTLRAKGVTTPYKTLKIYDVNPAFGGPLRRDRLWFYTGVRWWGTTDQPVGAFADTDPLDFVYTPDWNRPVAFPNWNRNVNLRLTWQASKNSKLAFYGDHIPRCWCAALLSSTIAYEASAHWEAELNNMFQATWSWTPTNRLLVEVGQAYKPERSLYDKQPELPADTTGIFEITTGTAFRSLFILNGLFTDKAWNGKASVSYVTGSSTFKVGAQWFMSDYGRGFFVQSDHYILTFNGSPVATVLASSPGYSNWDVNLDLGVYAQNQWTLKRLTLNLGARFDYLNASLPERSNGQRQFVGPTVFEAVKDLPNWTDISPRFGVSYDLFGNAKTALKWNLGRYVESMATGIAAAVDAVTSSGLNATTNSPTQNFRAITNGSFEVVCDGANPAANGNCGPSSNLNFGTNNPGVRYAPGTVTGWDTRGWNWETMIGVQHELAPGLSGEVSYHRRWNGNFRLTDNAFVTAADYDPYCVTAPVDPQLPGGGGNQICGLYDITPAKFGQIDNAITLSQQFGEQTQIFDSVDFNLSMRFAGGLTLQGGTSTGRPASSRCFVIDSPQELRFCDVGPPFQTQVKAMAVYPLPWWALQTSATYQSLPGTEILANWPAPSRLIEPSLGRPLAGGAATATIALVEPGTMFNDRLHQVDFRIARNFQLRQVRIQPMLDLYNMLNANTVIAQNNTYGPAWQAPSGILAGRIVKFGVQINY